MPPFPQERLFDAARNGDVGALAALLDEHPESLHVRTQPYEHSLLHVAAHNGRLAAVDLLLMRGLDVNVREKGDNTYPMHWAAAAGHLDVVRRLADAGGDVVGHGDDHALDVIGWATCWDGCDDATHRAVAEFLVGRGARHHIFSAISLSLGDEVRRIVATDPATLRRPMSRNEDYRLPLHYAVQRNRAEMVGLLLELGADPLAVDGSGFPPSAYATAPDTGRRVSKAIRLRGGPIDLLTALDLGDEETAARLFRESSGGFDPVSTSAGALHLMAKRGNLAAVKWLLARGVDPNRRWAHWDADVTAVHLAAAQGHGDVVRMLLAAGGDPRIRDSKHDGDAIGWAEHFGQPEIVRILEGDAGAG